MPRTVDQLRLEVVVDFGTQAADGDIDHIGIGVEIHVPYLRGDQRARKHLALVAHQQFEQREFLLAERDALARPSRPAPRQIETQVGDLQTVGHHRRRAPAQQGSHPGEQLREGEGLDEVVVASEFQAFDPVLDPVPSGQEQHRHLLPRVSERPDDAPAVDVGQHHVHDDEIERLGHGEMMAVQAVPGQHDGKARFRETLTQVVPRPSVILDNQQSHRRHVPLTSRSPA